VTRRAWPALVLAFIVFAAFPAVAQASPQTRALDYLHSKQLPSGGFGTGATADAQMTPWAIMAISAAGEGPQKAVWNRSGKDPVDYLQGLDLELAAGSSGNVSSPVNRPNFYAKVILAYVAAGRVDLIGSAGTRGIQLVPKMLSYQNATSGAFSPFGATTSNPYATVNSTAWALLALSAAGETDGNAAAAVTWLTAHQNGNGGFGSQPGAASDVDDTAAAVMALRSQGVSASNHVIVDALAFLKSAQRGDGGFQSMLTDGRSYAESTAWATQAIVACNQSPSSWNKGSNTPLSFLRRLQQPSGLFAHRVGAISTPLMTTTQAAIGLAQKPFPFGLPNTPAGGAFNPRFDSFSPSGKPTFKTSTVDVKATYRDNAGGTGIKVSAVRITVDQVNKTKAATVKSSSLALRLTGLSNGTHTVIIRIVDRAGNSISRTHQFIVSVPVAAPSTPATTPTPPVYRPPSNSGGTGTGTGTTPTTPNVLTPSPTTTTGSPTYGTTPGTVTGTPLGASPGAPLTASAEPSPSSSVTGQVTTNGQDGGSGMAGWIGLGLVALLPLGALASFVVHRRDEAALEGAGQGRQLTGGGTSWERFKARVFGVSSALTLKR
jgi:hypothetical protein